MSDLETWQPLTLDEVQNLFKDAQKDRLSQLLIADSGVAHSWLEFLK